MKFIVLQGKKNKKKTRTNGKLEQMVSKSRVANPKLVKTQDRKHS